MKSKFWYCFLITIGFVLINSDGCNKEDINKNTMPIGSDPVTDIDGNVYNTVIIGSQIWMTENLKVIHYRNGDPITLVPATDSAWWDGKLATEAYCNIDFDASENTIKARIYNWYAVTDSRKIAPVGWHIPTDDEWTLLNTYLGGGSDVGDKLKSTNHSFWPESINATNESGFTAIPTYPFHSLWWTSSEKSFSQAYYYELGDGIWSDLKSGRSIESKGMPFSIRCLKD
jgi:uncharacterized protein (TIGR02145 family)